MRWRSAVFATCAFGTLAVASAAPGDTPDAFALLEEARLAADQETQVTLKISNLGRLAVLYDRLGWRARAEQTLEHALAEARRDGNLALQAEVAQRRAEVGDVTSALAAAESLAKAVRDQVDLAARAHGMDALAKAYCAAGHNGDGLALISELSVMLRLDAEDPAQLRTLKTASVARLREAQLYCGQLDEILKAQDPSRRPTDLVHVAARFASAGSYERAHQVALRIPQPEWRAAALLAIARFKAREGTRKAGEAFAKEAYQVANAELHDNANPARQFRLVVDFGRTFGELGMRDAALQLLQEASRYADTVAKSGLKVELHHVVVRAYANAGEIEQAVTLARLIQDDYARADGLASVVAALLGCRDACT